MQVQCPHCQGAMQVGPELEGQSFGCPHCGQPLSLAGGKSAGPPVGAPPPGAGAAGALSCPSCGAVLGEADAICMTCGYDRRTGRVHASAMAGMSTAWSDPRGKVEQTPPIDMTWDQVGSKHTGIALGVLVLITALMLLILGAGAIERVIGAVAMIVVLGLVTLIGAACPPTARGFLYASAVAFAGLIAIMVLPPEAKFSGLSFVAAAWAIGGASVAHRFQHIPATRWAALGPAILSVPLTGFELFKAFTGGLDITSQYGLGFQSALVGAGVMFGALMVFASQVFALLQGIMPRVGGLFWGARATYLAPWVIAWCVVLVGTFSAQNGLVTLAVLLSSSVVASVLFVALSGYSLAWRALLLRYD